MQELLIFIKALDYNDSEGHYSSKMACAIEFYRHCCDLKLIKVLGFVIITDINHHFIRFNSLSELEAELLNIYPELEKITHSDKTHAINQVKISKLVQRALSESMNHYSRDAEKEIFFLSNHELNFYDCIKGCDVSKFYLFLNNFEETEKSMLSYKSFNGLEDNFIEFKFQFEYETLLRAVLNLLHIKFNIRSLKVGNIPMKKRQKSERKSYDVILLFKHNARVVHPWNLKDPHFPIHDPNLTNHLQRPVFWHKRIPNSFDPQLLCQKLYRASVLDVNASPTLVFVNSILSGQNFFLSNQMDSSNYSFIVRNHNGTLMIHELYEPVHQSMLYPLEKLDLKHFRSIDLFKIMQQSLAPLNSKECYSKEEIDLTNPFVPNIKSFNSQMTYFPPFNNEGVLFNLKYPIVQSVFEEFKNRISNEAISPGEMEAINYLLLKYKDYLANNDAFLFPSVQEEEKRSKLYKRLKVELLEMAQKNEMKSKNHEIIYSKLASFESKLISYLEPIPFDRSSAKMTFPENSFLAHYHNKKLKKSHDKWFDGQITSERSSE